MKYFINGKETDKENFDEEFEKKLVYYKQISEYWPEKDKIKDHLLEKGQFGFYIKNGKYVIFAAVEDEVAKMAEIIAQNEFDAYDDDSFTIAMALYKAGCRFVK